MRQILHSFLDRLGYEPKRPVVKQQISRSTMFEGVKWLSDKKIEIETILDVGASDGRWSKACMKYFPGKQFVLFEPQPVHASALDELERSREGISTVRKAVGGSDGTLLFDISDPFGGGPAVNGAEHVLEVEQVTIDTCIEEMAYKAPFLLKLDTHGLEKSILEGAPKTLSCCQALIIEAYNYRLTEDTMLFWELCAYLYEHGFRPIDLVDTMHRKFDDSLWQMDLFFVRSSWDGFGYINYT